jgi:hypothetical protein
MFINLSFLSSNAAKITYANLAAAAMLDYFTHNTLFILADDDVSLNVQTRLRQRANTKLYLKVSISFSVAQEIV